MTLREMYESINGDYEGVISRLMKEERVEKYLRIFLEATDYRDLKTALTEKNYRAAFLASHNLKGVCLNLGLNRLAESGSALCETMRHGAPEGDISAPVSAVDRDYEATCAAIRLFFEI